MHFHVQQNDVWKIQLLCVGTQDHKTGSGHDDQEKEDQENFQCFGRCNCEEDGWEMSHELVQLDGQGKVCLIQSVFRVVSPPVLCDATSLASWILFR